jgi:uncharacterized hydrophobic protein (TIGR00271 family)
MSMSEESTAADGARSFREFFARHLGVSERRKEELYIEILRSASLADVSFWLQVVFSAGIATLGLVLNSVAVIIGAMLISPLMGPILASGLALAAGDLILAVRALANLMLSCLLAVAFALLLVFVLPFKEMTAEIASRTHPNTLDLVVALFSGAVGSVAICKEVKGVVTSIPGVAIAVALMPPLCVTGYGLGIALGTDVEEGLRVATGGGLLFLTNLVAITFTAMVIFLLLHIDTPQVKACVRKWRRKDMTSRKVSRKVSRVMRRLPKFERLRVIGGLPARLLLIFALVLLLLVPLTQSLGRLKQELAQQRRVNRTRQAALEVWQQNFAQTRDGAQRCYVDNIDVSERDGKINLLLRVFTGIPYAAVERAEYIRLLASRLRVPTSTLALQLVEIPTTSSEMLARTREDEMRAEAPRAIASPTPPTAADTQNALLQLAGAAVGTLHLPAPAQLAGYEVTARPDAPLALRVGYLSPREISPDAQHVLAENIRAQLADPDAQTSFVWLEAERQLPAFRRNQSAVTDETDAQLAAVGDALRQYPRLRVRVVASADRSETEGIAAARAEAVAAYLTQHRQIPVSRVTRTTSDDAGRNLTLTLTLSDVEPQTRE